MRASNRRSCSWLLTSSQYLTRMIPASTMYFSTSGTVLQKASVLFFRTKPHDVFDPRAVVPTAVENDDLAGRREVRHVPLHVHLGLFAIRRRGNATTRNTRGLTRSVMARIVPPFPAPSRPSNRTIIRSPLCFTHA